MINAVDNLYLRYLPAERMNRWILNAVMLIIIWTSFELLFTRIWDDWAPVIPSLIGYLTEGVLIALVFVVVTHPVIGRKHLLHKLQSPLNVSLIIFLLFAFFSMLINNVPFIQGMFGIRAIMQFLVLYLILLTIPIPVRWVYKVFYVFIGLGVLQAVVGALEVLFRVPLPLRDVDTRRTVLIGEEIRAFGMMDSSNTLGAYLAAVLLLVILYLFIYKSTLNKKTKMILLVISGVLLGGIVLSFSRLAFLGLIGCFALIGLIFRKNKAFKIMLIASGAFFILFVLAYGLALLLFEGFVQRNINTFDLSRNYRFLIITSGLLVFTFSPVFGVGPGMFGSNAAFFFDSPMHQFMHEDIPSRMSTVDNNALYVLVEYGVIGVALLAFVFLVIFRTLIKLFESDKLHVKWVALFTMAFSTSWIIIGTLFTAWENHQIALFFWLFLGIAINWYKEEKAIGNVN